MTVSSTAKRPVLLCSQSSQRPHSSGYSSKTGTGGAVGGSASSFRPRRRPSPSYRPMKIPGKVKKRGDWTRGNQSQLPVHLGQIENPKDELEAELGPLAAGVVRDLRRTREQNLTAEEEMDEALRLIDYFNAPDGSTEDLIGERRALAMQGLKDPEDRKRFLDSIEEMIEEGRQLTMGLGEDGWIEDKKQPEAELDLRDLMKDREETTMEEEDRSTKLDPNQLAHGVWSELLIAVDRNVKMWRGGRLESYRALVIGGNMNGCGGFGIGKSQDPLMAVEIAGRHCRRNIFFVERYQGNGLTSDLVGKQNSCVVTLRATDNGLRGNDLCREILKRFGITNCVPKSHGNRNPFNVVRATFKALMTHESLEEIALKRGKRLVSVDRAMRMQI